MLCIYFEILLHITYLLENECFTVVLRNKTLVGRKFLNEVFMHANLIVKMMVVY